MMLTLLKDPNREAEFLAALAADPGAATRVADGSSKKLLLHEAACVLGTQELRTLHHTRTLPSCQSRHPRSTNFLAAGDESAHRL